MRLRFLATFAVARRSPEGSLDSPSVATARGQKTREVTDFRMGSYCACSRPAECRSARVSRTLVWRSITSMARVLLADPQPLFNEALEALLSRRDVHQVIGRSSSVLEIRPEIKVLVLGDDRDPDLLLASIRAGAAGLIGKTHGSSTMLRVTGAVLAGEAAMP